MNPQEIPPRLYLCQFDLHVAQATIHIKFPCTFFLSWSIGKPGDTNCHAVSTVHDQVTPNASTITFRTLLSLEAELLYDGARCCFLPKAVRAQISQSTIAVYLTSSSRPNEDSKLAGLVRVDLAACLNSSAYQQEKEYLLERCPDKSSTICFSLRARTRQELEYAPVDRNSRSESMFQHSFCEDKSSSSISIKLGSRSSSRDLQSKNVCNDGRAEGRHDSPVQAHSSQIFARQLANDWRDRSASREEEAGFSSAVVAASEQDAAEKLSSEAGGELEREGRALRCEIELLRERLRVEQNRTAAALRGVSSSSVHFREVASRQQDAELLQLRGQLASAEESLGELTKMNMKLAEELRRRVVLEQARASTKRSLQIQGDLLGGELLGARHEELLKEREQNIRLLRRVDELEFALADKERAHQQLREQLSFAQSCQAAHEEQLRSYQERQACLKQNFEEIEVRSSAVLQELQESQQECDRLLGKVDEASEGLKEATNKLTFVENQLAERDQTLKVVCQDMEDLKEENKSLQLEVDNLTKLNLELATSADSSRYRHQEQLKKLSSQMRDAQRSYELRHLEASQQMRFLEEQQERLQNKYADLEMLTLELTRERDFHMESTERMKQSIERARDERGHSYSSYYDLNRKLEQANRQISNLNNEIKAKNTAIRELQSCVTSFVEEGIRNSIDLAKSEEQEASVESLMLAEDLPHLTVVSPDTSELQRKLEELQYQNSCLRAEIADHEMALSNALKRQCEAAERLEVLHAQIKADDRNSKAAAAEKEALSYEVERAKATLLEYKGEATWLRVQAEQKLLRIRKLEEELSESRLQIDRLQGVVRELHESDNLNMNELKMVKEECVQYRELYNDARKRAQECKQQLATRQVEHQRHSQSETRQSGDLLGLKEYTGVIKSYYAHSVLNRKDLEQRVLELITRNQEVSRQFRGRVAAKEQIDLKLLELSKELRRFKAQLLSQAGSIDGKKQVLLLTRPYERLVEQIQNDFKGLCGSLMAEQPAKQLPSEPTLTKYRTHHRSISK